MKAVLFTSILSIFFAIPICKAQSKPVSNDKVKYQINICNQTSKFIHLADINKFSEEGCDRIIYTDAAGKELTLTKYVIAISPAKGGNSYFEEVIGNKLTPTIKERLEKLKLGDLIVVTQVIDTKSTSTIKSGNASRMYKIVE